MNNAKKNSNSIGDKILKLGSLTYLYSGYQNVLEFSGHEASVETSQFHKF